MIDSPMDLSRVHEKMLTGKYCSLSGFCRDMRLIFNNSRTYNINKRSRVSLFACIFLKPLCIDLCSDFWNISAYNSFYARKQNALRVFAIVWASVRPSVTLVSCIKTVQARITKSSPWIAPRSLVYRDKISCHWVQGFPSNEGVEEGYPLKKTSFCPYWLE